MASSAELFPRQLADSEAMGIPPLFPKTRNTYLSTAAGFGQTMSQTPPIELDGARPPFIPVWLYALLSYHPGAEML